MTTTRIHSNKLIVHLLGGGRCRIQVNIDGVGIAYMELASQFWSAYMLYII